MSICWQQLRVNFAGFNCCDPSIDMKLKTNFLDFTRISWKLCPMIIAICTIDTIRILHVHLCTYLYCWSSLWYCTSVLRRMFHYFSCVLTVRRPLNSSKASPTGRLLQKAILSISGPAGKRVFKEAHAKRMMGRQRSEIQGEMCYLVSTWVLSRIDGR